MTTNDGDQPISGDLPSYGSVPPPPQPPPGSYPPPPPGGYGAPAPGGYGGVPQQNKKALWSMILGILGLLCCGLAGIPALILGNQAKQEIASSGGTQTGDGMAKAGVILGIIALVLMVIGAVGYGVLIATGNWN